MLRTWIEFSFRGVFGSLFQFHDRMMFWLDCCAVVKGKVYFGLSPSSLHIMDERWYCSSEKVMISNIEILFLLDDILRDIGKFSLQICGVEYTQYTHRTLVISELGMT